MPETPVDKLQGWLEREEEEFGITGAVSRTIDFDACYKMLKEELGYEPSVAQIDLMMQSARYRYAELPVAGARTEQVIYPWGATLWYRDVATGRRISAETVQERLRAAGLD